MPTVPSISMEAVVRSTPGGEETGSRWRAGGRSILAGAGAVLVALSTAVPAEAAPGRVYQFNNAYGCVTDSGSEGCATGRGLAGSSSAAVSPDGKNIYVASSEADSLTTFRRDKHNGRAIQPSGDTGCLSATGHGKCATGFGLDGAASVAVSPDGRHVYVASLEGELAVFRRDGRQGFLEQLPGLAGCLSVDGAPGCGQARGIFGASGVAVSPDGRNVYVAGLNSDAVASFNRDVGSGALSQPGGAAGCISDAGTEGCATGRALNGPFSLTMDSTGTRLFVPASNAHAIAVLIRDPHTGLLTQDPSGVAGCVAMNGAEGCGTARGLVRPAAAALSLDRDLYVASLSSDSLTSFRVAPSGALLQRPGKEGCRSATGDENCAFDRALDGAFAVTASIDGRNVYAGSGQAVIAMRRKRSGVLRRVGCTSDGGVAGCATGRALADVSSIALSPKGKHLYVSAFESGSLATFARDPQRGVIRVKIARRPKHCVRGRFRTKAKVRSRLPLREVRVFMDGRRIDAIKAPRPPRSRQYRFPLKVHGRQLTGGRHMLKLAAIDVSGTRDRLRAGLRRC